MRFEFIHSTLKMTCFCIFISFFYFLHFFSFIEAISFVLGGLWASTNLYLLMLLAQTALLSEGNVKKVLFYLGLKFPLLYFLGYLLLMNEHLSINFLLLGPTSLVMAMMLRKATPLFWKTNLWLMAFCSTHHLHALLESEVPEVPNFFTLLDEIFQSSLTAFLHDWATFFFSLLVAILLSVIFYKASRNPQEIPHGLQNAVEGLVELLRRFIISVLGPQGEQFLPFLGTLFIYILAMNWLAIVPFMKPPTSNFNITIALALVVFGLVQYLNFKSWGFFGFLYHMAGSPKSLLDWLLVPLLFPIELLTQITRPLTLALRLFGNVVGEDILIGAAALFGVYLLSSTNLAAGLPAQIPFAFLALLTGLMQALVFTLLSTIYILLSLPHEEKHGKF